jgi:hypothetical protein
MSYIIKALEKAQRKLTDNAKIVLRKNAAIDKDNPPVSENYTVESEAAQAPLNGINIILGVVLVITIAGVAVFLNNRITSGINVTNSQMTALLDHLKKQEEKVIQLNESIQKLEASAGAQTKEMNAGFTKLNGELTSKIGNLRGELNNQKAVWDSAINEQGKAVAQTREQFEQYKTENRNLKDQVELLKEKVDVIINVPTTP